MNLLNVWLNVLIVWLRVLIVQLRRSTMFSGGLLVKVPSKISKLNHLRVQ